MFLNTFKVITLEFMMERTNLSSFCLALAHDLRSSSTLDKVVTALMGLCIWIGHVVLLVIRHDRLSLVDDVLNI